MKRNINLTVFYMSLDDREKAIQRELKRQNLVIEQCKSILCFPDTQYFRKQNNDMKPVQLSLFEDDRNHDETG